MKIDDVLGRMHNWKQRSAYNFAKEVKEFPKEALKTLKELSEKYNNCGWSAGLVFNNLQNENNKVAKILGYKFDNNEDYWVKIKKKVKKNGKSK